MVVSQLSVRPEVRPQHVPTVFAQSDAAATILFHHAILCGFYSRAATNQERCLLNSVLSVKSFVNVRACFEKS